MSAQQEAIPQAIYIWSSVWPWPRLFQRGFIVWNSSYPVLFLYPSSYFSHGIRPARQPEGFSCLLPFPLPWIFQEVPIPNLLYGHLLTASRWELTEPLSHHFTFVHLSLAKASHRSVPISKGVGGLIQKRTNSEELVQKSSYVLWLWLSG